MIWIVMTRTDTDNYVSERNVRFIKEALGDDVRIVSVTRDTCLDFICREDIVIAQTRDREVLDRIVERGVANTVETERTIRLTKDKEEIKGEIEKLSSNICSARTIRKREAIEEGKTYFVKPRFGEDSNGVDERSKCTTARQVQMKCDDLLRQGYEPIVEEYIDGYECTAAVLNDGSEVRVFPVKVNIPTEFVTHDVKFSENEVCEPLRDAYLSNIIRAVVSIIFPDCHYMRVDFRVKGRAVYIIDFNLFPGLGPIDHFAKCLTLNKNMSYRDALLAIAGTADRRAKSTKTTNKK